MAAAAQNDFSRKFLIIENKYANGILSIEKGSRETKLKIKLTGTGASENAKITAVAIFSDRQAIAGHLWPAHGETTADAKFPAEQALIGVALVDDSTKRRIYEYGDVPEKLETTPAQAQAQVPAQAQAKREEVPQPANATAAGQTQDARAEKVDFAALTKELDAHFSKSDPFGTKRTDYMWWHVDSAVTLNDILHKLGVKTGLMYDPGMLTAYYKHSHMIFGFYTGHADGRYRMLAGIPANYDPGAKPKQPSARWAQLDGLETEKGKFGYWVILI